MVKEAYLRARTAVRSLAPGTFADPVQDPEYFENLKTLIEFEIWRNPTPPRHW